MIKSPSSVPTEFMREIFVPLDSNVISEDPSPNKFLRSFDSSRCPTSISDESVDLLCHKSSSIHALSSSVPDSELNNKIEKIESAVLEKLIATDCSLIILDLRSAYNFSKMHITTARLANCSSKMKSRRAIQIVIEILKTSLDLHHIVLYTEFGLPFKQDDPLTILIQFLLGRSINCLYLTDSFKKFETAYPQLCESGSSNVLCQHIPKSVPDFTDIYFTKASLVLPFLYLGNELDALNSTFLTNNKITHVLNVTIKASFLDEIKFKSKRINCTDNNVQDLIQFFPDAFKFIELARQSNGKILVHCQAGISRSATIVIAYLMSHCSNLDLNNAHQWVKRRRTIISPNFNFMGQLVQFENDLISGTFKRNSVLNFDLITSSMFMGTSINF
uniref:protein-tyrosine-phosphatase n=1 Tax=Dugesia japonica TaxID=6161 RepID=F8WLE5_DUGJA|nr:mitogen-activated protein kinase phosphatase [Dugesia japonica]